MCRQNGVSLPDRGQSGAPEKERWAYVAFICRGDFSSETDPAVWGSRRCPDLQEKIKKEDLAKQIAERDHIEEGLICILSVLEPCRTFSFRTEKGKPFVASARRKCLFLYFYFINRDFGLMHVRLQTWFPLQIQVYVNGHEWLARKLKQSGIRYTKRDNAFLWIEDLARAQKLSDRFLFPRLAPPAEPLRQKGQSADGGSCENDAVLRGHRPERLLDRNLIAASPNRFIASLAA